MMHEARNAVMAENVSIAEALVPPIRDNVSLPWDHPWMVLVQFIGNYSPILEHVLPYLLESLDLC
jgi:hypothetical protein